MSHACVDPARCPPEVSRARCDGPDAVLSCHDGAIERSACLDNTTCREHTHEEGTEFATCTGGSLAECDSIGSRRCDANRLLVCEAHGHSGRLRETNCAALGLSCSAAGARASCVAQPAECGAGAARCEGDALSFCAAGRRERVSCASLGMGPCDPDARGLEAGCKVAKDRPVR